MKQLLIILTIAFASCADYDREPLLWQELRGEWTRADDPNWHYIFAQDYATEWKHNLNTTFNGRWYSTEQTGYRSLTLININTGDTSRWIVGRVFGDSTVAVNDVTNPDWFQFYLKKK